MPSPKKSAGLSELSKLEKLSLLLGIVLVAVVVALVYFYFEAAVRHSINYVWTTLFNTGSKRYLVIPICFVLSFVFFWLQHHFDPKSEKHESHGLGDAPKPTIVNFVKVLGLGFASLVAGASLGPEAILVPASMIVGGYLGSQLFKKNPEAVKLLAMVGFISLIAAFFHSFIAGMLGLLLVTKQVKIRLSLVLIVVAALASISTVLVLKQLESPSFVKLPGYSWDTNFTSIFILLVMFFGGFVAIHILKFVSDQFHSIKESIKGGWQVTALVAATGLSLLYLLGGNLVEFTGNNSIVPMFNRAASLGLIGLLWILIIKICAIGWSKESGYRGGLIFPTIFVASVVVAIGQYFDHNVSLIVGLVFVLGGVFLAESKVKVLL